MRYPCSSPASPAYGAPRRHSRGFTLIEMVVVLFVIGLSTGLVVMAVGRTKDKTVLEREARKLHRVLGYARELALMQRTPFTFVPDPEAGTYRLEKDGAPYGNVYRIEKGLVLFGKPIVFLPKGSSTGGGISVTDSLKRRGYIVKVDPQTGVAEIFRLQPS